MSLPTLRLICFTQAGAQTAQRLLRAIDSQFCCEGVLSSRFAGSSCLPKTELSLADWTRKQFSQADCLVFVGACGIAVRAIAPFVKDKFADPAVLVIDEQGRFCISLLSGHVGGANAFANLCAQALGATPVITTATDLNHAFAVDVFAKQNDLLLTDRLLAKQLSAAVLAGQPVGFSSVFAGMDVGRDDGMDASIHADALPQPLCQDPPEGAPKFAVSFFAPDDPATLWLIPKGLVLGIGCRKGTPQESIEQFVQQTLAAHRLSMQSVSAVASIDLKAQEEGLLSFCAAQRLPFVTYDAQSLLGAKGEFSPSAFVQQVTGVDNVCERSAVLHSGGRLLLPKQKGCGVTLAAAANLNRTLIF